MAGLAHAGIGLAAKKYAPTIPVPLLIAAAYALDIIWGILFAAGFERYPTEPATTANPLSHGLFLALVWSLFFSVIANMITGSRRISIVIGLLVFSHWMMDFISHPMTAVFPLDTGLPLLFDGSPLVGLGMWEYAAGVYIGEYGTFTAGLIIYLLYRKNSRYQGKGISTLDGN